MYHDSVAIRRPCKSNKNNRAPSQIRKISFEEISAYRQLVEMTVCIWFGIPVSEMRARTRRRAKVAYARQVAMYLMRITFELSLTEIGSLFERDRTTAAHACKVVEDSRDDPDVDETLERIEQAIMSWHVGMSARWAS